MTLDEFSRQLRSDRHPLAERADELLAADLAAATPTTTITITVELQIATLGRWHS